jgi:hypothetical protein
MTSSQAMAAVSAKQRQVTNSERLTEVIVEITVFSDVTMMHIDRRFGGSCGFSASETLILLDYPLLHPKRQ